MEPQLRIAPRGAHPDKGRPFLKRQDREIIAAQRELEERPGSTLIGIPTGFTDLDRITHGLNKGNLIIIAGRPGMGKTSLALNIAQHVAIREKRTVGVFSLEMSQQELM